MYCFSFKSYSITKISYHGKGFKIYSGILILVIGGDQTHQQFNLCFVPVDALLHRSLQYERNVSEVRTVNNPPEALQPDGSLADVLVTVSVTAHRSHTKRIGVHPGLDLSLKSSLKSLKSLQTSCPFKVLRTTDLANFFITYFSYQFLFFHLQYIFDVENSWILVFLRF